MSFKVYFLLLFVLMVLPDESMEYKRAGLEGAKGKESNVVANGTVGRGNTTRSQYTDRMYYSTTSWGAVAIVFVGIVFLGIFFWGENCFYILKMMLCEKSEKTGTYRKMQLTTV